MSYCHLCPGGSNNVNMHYHPTIIAKIKSKTEQNCGPLGPPTTSEPTAKPTSEPTPPTTSEPTAKSTSEPTVTPPTTSEPTAKSTSEPTVMPPTTSEPTEAATDSQYVLLGKGKACGSSAEVTSKEKCFAASKTFDLPLHKNKNVNKAWLPTGCSVRKVTKGKFEGKYVVFFNKATGKANPKSKPVCLNLPTDEPTSSPTTALTMEPTSEPTEAETDSQYVLLGKGTACGSSAEVTPKEKCFAASKTFDLPLHKNKNVNKAWLPTGCSVRKVTKGKFEGKYVVFFNKATGKANPKSKPVCLNLPTR